MLFLSFVVVVVASQIYVHAYISNERLKFASKDPRIFGILMCVWTLKDRAHVYLSLYLSCSVYYAYIRYKLWRFLCLAFFHRTAATVLCTFIFRNIGFELLFDYISVICSRSAFLPNCDNAFDYMWACLVCVCEPPENCKNSTDTHIHTYI